MGLAIDPGFEVLPRLVILGVEVRPADRLVGAVDRHACLVVGRGPSLGVDQPQLHILRGERDDIDRACDVGSAGGHGTSYD